MLLNMLGAIDDKGIVTNIGKIMSKFPLEPSLSRAIVAASENKYSCVFEVASICAMVSTEQIWFSPPRKSSGNNRASKDFSKSSHHDDHLKRVEECHQALYHSAGDHLTYLSILNTWEVNNCSRQWCESNYISYRALNTARRIR